jgi:hypothetical protein
MKKLLSLLRKDAVICRIDLNIEAAKVAIVGCESVFD